MTPEELIKAVDDLPSYILGKDIELYHKYANLFEKPLIFDACTGYGKSAVALALANPNGVVITVDNGDAPVAREWTESLDAYTPMIEATLEKHHVDNVNFILGDVYNEFVKGLDYDIVHIDIEASEEPKFLEFCIPYVADGGYILIRNFNRFKEEADLIVEKAELKFIEAGGVIRVYQK